MTTQEVFAALKKRGFPVRRIELADSIDVEDDEIVLADPRVSIQVCSMSGGELSVNRTDGDEYVMYPSRPFNEQGLTMLALDLRKALREAG